MIGVLLHVEDSRVVGITPSMLESVRLYAKAFGVDTIHIIDKMPDGYFEGIGDSNVSFQRWASLDDWAASVGEASVIAFETANTITAAEQTPVPLLALTHPADDVWYAFGPSMGFDGDFIDGDKTWVFLNTPVSSGAFNSREVLTLALAHRYFASLQG